VSFEAQGTGIAEAARALEGASAVEARELENGRTNLTITVTGQRDLRPELFRLAVSRGWTVYDLHQEAGSLEDLFRELTTAGDKA